MGYAVFFADVEAKKCMNNSAELKSEITHNFGNNIYENGTFQKENLADIVFSDSKKLEILNQLVHPFVQRAFVSWSKNQKSELVIKEAAILFESGANKGLDGVICISAPLQKRIERVMKRDNCSEQEVLDRIANQMLQEEKVQLSDFIIVNDEKEKLLPQIISICKKLTN